MQKKKGSENFLGKCILHICSSIPSEGEMKEFIHLCMRISYSYLTYKISRGYAVLDRGNGSVMDLEDIAVDAVADLFERNEHGEYVQLKRYFIPRFNKERDEDELLLLVRKLVTSSCEQHLSALFRQRDPVTANILRRIRECVRQDRYNTGKYRKRKTVTIWKGETDKKPVQDPFSLALLFQDAWSVFRPGDTVPVLLRKIFDTLIQFPEGGRPLFLDDITMMIRSYRKQFAGNTPVTANIGNNLQEQQAYKIDMAVIMEEVLKELYNKIDNKK